MKKPLAFIVLLVTLTGTFYPCCLTDKCGADEVAIPTTTHNEKKQTGEGACSPFSTCASCSGFVQITTPELIKQPQPQKQVHHQRQLVFNLSTYSNKCWQPPRIAKLL